MAQKDRKTQKLRGSRTCGYGNTKKHRGSGSRGGRGLAGSSNHRWSYISKYHKDYFGRRGFKRPVCMVSDDATINVGRIDSMLDRMVSEGNVEQKDGRFYIDLTNMGFDKLLGSGSVTHVLEVKVAKSSKSAIEKIEAAGGKVEVLEGGSEFEEFTEVADETDQESE